MAMETWVLDKIFDRARGWEIPAEAAPIKRVFGSDGNPNYIVTLDGINIHTWEVHRWNEGIYRDVSPGRLAARVEFTGVTIHRMQALLTDNFGMNGLPAFGLTAAGQPTLHTAFPISPDFPVDLARRQLMVCIGTLAVQARELLTAWNSKPNSTPPQNNFDWSKAKGVASVVGAFLGAFVGN